MHGKKKKSKDEHKDKFDEDIKRDGMGPVDNENSGEEEGMNRGKKRNSPQTGEGIEEFTESKPNSEDDDNENEEDNR